MKRMGIIGIILLLWNVLLAQNVIDTIQTRPIYSVTFNFVGDASLVSINYERLYLINSIFFVAAKIGVGYNEEFQLNIFGSPSTPPERFITIPHHITCNIGKGSHFFEIGLGGTIINGSYISYPIVGYRIQPKKTNKLNFRIYGEVPITGIEMADYILFIPIGLSFGACF